MGRLVPHDSTCDRAQAWASTDLDGELSQIERVLLFAHLRKCRSCAAVAAEMRAFTRVLREAPLEAPSRPLFVARQAPSRRYARTAGRLALAATLTALAAGLGALAGSLGRDDAAPARTNDPSIALLPSQDDVRDIRGLRSPKERPAEPLLPPGRARGV